MCSASLRELTKSYRNTKSPCTVASRTRSMSNTSVLVYQCLLLSQFGFKPWLLPYFNISQSSTWQVSRAKMGSYRLDTCFSCCFLSFFVCYFWCCQDALTRSNFYFRIATRTVKLKTKHNTLITQSDLAGVNRWTPTHAEWKPSSKKISVKILPVSITDVVATAPRVTFLLRDASPFCTTEFYLPMCAKNSRHTVSWEAEGAPWRAMASGQRQNRIIVNIITSL